MRHNLENKLAWLIQVKSLTKEQAREEYDQHNLEQQAAALTAIHECDLAIAAVYDELGRASD